MIVVTAPTGSIGRQLLDKLVATDEEIRVIVRDASKLGSYYPKRVEVVLGSHGDYAVVSKAFKGAESVFWLAPPDPEAPSMNAAYVDFTRPAIKAILEQEIKRVVSISALGRGHTDHSGLVAASLAMDDLIASTGVRFRAMTMPSFMDNLLNQATAIKTQGMFFSPISGDRKMPTCATRDIASVAARLLLDHTWDGQESVAVLGPEDLSFNDMAEVMSQVLGKPIHFKQIPGEAFKARLTGFGMSEAMSQGMLDMMNAKNDGLDNIESRTITSSSPTSFKQWCEEVLKPAIMA